jgi:hypothetical protein
VAPAKRTSAPRQRAAAPPNLDRLREEFHEKARVWLLGRPGRTMQMPADLSGVVSLGVPCNGCGFLIYQDRQGGHRVQWRRAEQGKHWASGITVIPAASCKKTA